MTKLTIDYSALHSQAKKLNGKYAENSPCPHISMDKLFDEKTLLTVEQECSDSFKDIEKHFYGSVGKHATNKRKYWGPTTKALLTEFNSAEFLSFLELLTGIEGLIPDPYYEGGGIHETKRGGFLKVHTDFNYNKKLKLDRRVNLILYLNSDWQESYGGHLELWDSNMLSCETKILPIINRTVVFNTNDYSFHGHPDPLSCPDDRSRKSLALYYYTNGRPQSEIKTEKSSQTNYQPRPGEEFDGSTRKTLAMRVKRKILRLLN